MALAILGGVLLPVPLQACSPRAPTAPEEPRRLENGEVGYSLTYPAEWQLRGRLTASAFAQDGRCESVEVVDFAPPPDAGPGAALRHAFVQVCWKSRADGLSLVDFLRAQYGSVIDRFEETTLGGVPAYRARREGSGQQFLLQTARHRLEVVSAVATDADRAALRESQADKVLASFRLDEARR
jgi:hypothetical protein